MDGNASLPEMWSEVALGSFVIHAGSAWLPVIATKRKLPISGIAPAFSFK
jgi:hypothetical protein